MKTSKKCCLLALGLTLGLMLIFGGITVVIDPFFHFHGPWSWQKYSLYNERYQNDGIARYFDYDAIITGTSMTQNFKTSECDQLFGVRSIKTPFPGSYHKETSSFLSNAIQRNPDLKIIIRGIDSDRMIRDKDDMRYDSCPEYLYDDDPFNDVQYLFNKEIFVNDICNALSYAASNQESTSFDAYSNWQEKYSFNKEAILETYDRLENPREVVAFSEEDEETVRANISQNVTGIVASNPQIDFFLFFPPYSIYYWDDLTQRGQLQRQLEAQRIAIEMMLQYENVHLFSFFDAFDVVCNADNYKDTRHYSENINSQMLEWMHTGAHELTLDNYGEYLNEISEFYSNYPYSTLFES